MKNNIFNIIATLIIGTIFNFIVNCGVTYVNSDKAVVRIGEVIKTGDANYVCNIDISNFYKKDMDDIRFTIPDNIDLQNFYCNNPIKIKKIESDISGNTDSVFSISGILNGQTTSLVMNLNSDINAKDILVSKNDYKIKVKYGSNEERPIYEAIRFSIIIAIVYAIVMALMNFYLEKIRDIKIAKAKEGLEKQLKETEKSKELVEKQYNEAVDSNKKVNEKVNKVNEELNDIKLSLKKEKILLLNRIRDYKKELNFWRDTIRKILYENHYSDRQIERVFDSVTSNLETYGTKENEKISYDEIKILSDMLKDK